jgi:hypothetical protein
MSDTIKYYELRKELFAKAQTLDRTSECRKLLSQAEKGILELEKKLVSKQESLEDAQCKVANYYSIMMAMVTVTSTVIVVFLGYAIL